MDIITSIKSEYVVVEISHIVIVSQYQSIGIPPLGTIKREGSLALEYECANY